MTVMVSDCLIVQTLNLIVQTSRSSLQDIKVYIFVVYDMDVYKCSRHMCDGHGRCWVSSPEGLISHRLIGRSSPTDDVRSEEKASDNRITKRLE